MKILKFGGTSVANSKNIAQVASIVSNVNEKNVVGFAAFLVMVIFAAVDIITGVAGKHLEIQEYIYNSFVIIALGSFGIAEAGKIFGGKKD